MRHVWSLLVGPVLLMAAASPGRWKRWPQPAAAPGTVDPVVDTGRIDAVAAWRPFPGDASQPTVSGGAPPAQPAGTDSDAPLTGPWAPPPQR